MHFLVENGFCFPSRGMNRILIKCLNMIDIIEGPSWQRSYGSWIYNYLRNRYLSPLMLWVLLAPRARCTTLCDKVCQWLATGRWLSPGLPVSSTIKTDRHVITKLWLKMALSTIKQTNRIIEGNSTIRCFLFIKDYLVSQISYFGCPIIQAWVGGSK